MATLLPWLVAAWLALAVNHASTLHSAPWHNEPLAAGDPAPLLTDWGGELTEDTVLDPAGNPHVVNADLIVPAGITLTIEPGVEMRFAPGAALIVRGRLLAAGTPTQTIRFTWRDPGAYWSQIVIDQSDADNRVAYAEIDHMQGFAAQHSAIRLLHSEIHDIGGDAVVTSGGTVTIQGNHVYDVDCVVHGCEGIQVRETPSGSPARVLDNHVHHVNDDCLDVNDSHVIVRRNRLHHCHDKGISIGSIGGSPPPATWPSSATLVNNLVYSSSIGIAVKDDSFAHVVHNTLADNQEGLALYEAYDHPGYGGGRARVVNTILWGNERSIRLDLTPSPPSTVTVIYSDVEGGWPGAGNLDADPSFEALDNYRLRACSPAVDAGYDAGVPTDLDGLPRPAGGAPDMGAYELQSLLHLSAWPGDRRIYLAWQVAGHDPALTSFAISYTVRPRGSSVYSHTLITGLHTTTLAYTLTDLINYARYTVVIEAWDAAQDLLERSNPVSLMPTEYFAYLPLLFRYR